jgi:hypothetical protein
VSARGCGRGGDGARTWRRRGPAARSLESVTAARPGAVQRPQLHDGGRPLRRHRVAAHAAVAHGCCCPLCLCTPCSAPCPLGTTTRRCRGIFAPHRRRQPVRSHRHRARGRAGVYRGMQSGLGTGVTSCRRSRWRRGCRARSSGLPLPRGRHRRGRRRGPPRMPSLGPPPGWKTLTRASGTRSRRTGSRSRTRCSSATSSRQVAPSHCARCRAKSPRNQRPASSRSERPGHPLLLFLPCPPPLLSAALLRRRRSQLPRVCVMAAAHSAMK